MMPSRDIPRLVNGHETGELDLDEMAARTIRLEDTEEAFEAMERGETLRSVIPLPD